MLSSSRKFTGSLATLLLQMALGFPNFEFSDPPCLNVPAQWYMHLLNVKHKQERLEFCDTIAQGLTQGSYTSYSLLLNPSSTFSRFFKINILQDQHGSHKKDRLMYSNDHPTPLHQIKHDIILLSSIHVHLCILSSIITPSSLLKLYFLSLSYHSYCAVCFLPHTLFSLFVCCQNH